MIGNAQGDGAIFFWGILGLGLGLTFGVLAIFWLWEQVKKIYKKGKSNE